MAEVQNNFKFGYVTDPQNAHEKESAIKKLKAEQDARAKSLFTQLEEQRKVYAEAKKEFYEAKSENYRLKKKNEGYQENKYVKKRNQEKFDASSLALKDARSTRESELSRLQLYTDDYCSAQTLALQVSIFAQ